MKSKTTKKSKRIESFTLINAHAAGIDVGDKEMVVALSPEVCVENVRTFGTFTCDYESIVTYLKECQITHVALESTGVYWVQLYLYLLKAGFDVMLAHAKHIKNVSGRKDDEIDAVWIQRLHSYGLINGGFQPNLEIRTLRDLMRHRRALVQDQSRCTNRIIKALELMNIKVQTVISDIGGKTGRAIVEAILAGERNATVLASLADPRIKASSEEMTKSLQGIWSSSQLFLLRQHYNTHQFLSQQIQQTDLEVEQCLQLLVASHYQGRLPIDDQQTTKRTTRKNAIPFNVTAYLNALLHTDLTEIPGVGELTALELISETGLQMDKWPTEKHFASWLNIVPNTKKSGGKIISSKMMKKKHRAGQILRMAASTLRRSKAPLGDFYRRKQAQGGPGKAVLASATKIAVSIYKMIQNREQYQPNKIIENHLKFRNTQIKRLEDKLARLKATA